MEEEMQSEVVVEEAPRSGWIVPVLIGGRHRLRKRRRHPIAVYHADKRQRLRSA